MTLNMEHKAFKVIKSVEDTYVRSGFFYSSQVKVTLTLNRFLLVHG
jgi:hypothetical protein